MSFDRSDLFLGLLDEEFEQFGVQVLGIGRDDRQRHDLGRLRSARRYLLLRMGFDVRDRQFLRDFRRFSFLFEARANVAQHREACLCVVQHVPGIGTPGFHRLHVVLDADDGVGEAIGLLLREPRRAAALQGQDDQLADAVHDVHGPGLVQHQQPGPDAPHQ